MELCGDCQTKYLRIEKLKADNAFQVLAIAALEKVRDELQTEIEKLELRLIDD